MSAIELLNSLVGRGLSLAVQGEKLRVVPASLLTDEDRGQIRLHRAELVDLIPVRASSELAPPPKTKPKASERSPGSYCRPKELAYWPIPDRQRWGELANELEDQGTPWQEAETAAFEIVKAERKKEGEIFLFIQDLPDLDPFPAWCQLIDPKDPLAQGTPPARPPEHPTWGLTTSLRVVELAKWTTSDNARDPIKSVTREGWKHWFPVQAELGVEESTPPAGFRDQQQPSLFKEEQHEYPSK
jgi:hypothetical protein